ncbi:MAG: glycoside hydrolase family 127 protein, partial [Acidobacteria bacterium]|nr:glycoside hydrolase family 127 protein [Acidobacteriota bacterium]
MRPLLFTILVPCLLAAAVADKVQPRLHRQPGIEFRFDGELGKRLRANLENWELRAPDANPAILQMFFDRDRKPDRKLLPWSGEFVGKYLGASILSYRILRDPRQKELIDRTVALLIRSQGADGYLGPFSPKDRLTGNNWDVWGHYWVLRALLLYDEEFRSEPARQAAFRAAGMLVEKFAGKAFRLTNDGSFGQMNYSVIHAFAKLYRLSGNPAYLRMADWIVKEWDRPGAGLYLRFALAGKEMYEMPGNRWESLHGFQGMYETYLLTGDERLGTGFRHLWNSILKGDRHNTGGFTSGERTTGNPYDLGAIETCCTVAWIDMTIDMLKLSGDSLVADELELSTFNGMIGGQHPSGRWWTYNTPMDGDKKSSAHQINFQCRPGSPELNCCSVNAPRGMALVTEWALLHSDRGVVLNYYGPSRFRTTTPAGRRLVLNEATTYPVNGAVQITVDVEQPERFPLALRIP